MSTSAKKSNVIDLSARFGTKGNVKFLTNHKARDDHKLRDVLDKDQTKRLWLIGYMAALYAVLAIAFFL